MTEFNTLSVINLSTYTSPEVSEDRSRDWVNWVTQEGEDYFTYLIDRFNGSATNNAIITALSKMIFGKGVAATNSDKQVEGYLWLKTVVRDKELRKVAHDLKLFNKFAFQVIWAKDGQRISEVKHFPVDKLRAEKCNDEGDIEAYYYAWDWDEVNKKNTKQEPKRIPVFNPENPKGEQVLYCNPYNSGYYYYSPVDYQGGVQYAQLEEEVSNYHINNIMNGLAPSMMVNFNNGIPESEEERRLIENRVLNKFSGSSNAGRVIIAFNDDKESAATIEPVQLSDAHNQYQFLSDECMRKLLVAHRVTSPMLLGIKDQTGLGNNAEELKTASTLFDNTVVIPYQEMIIEALDEMLNAQGFELDLYFKTLQPLEFVDPSQPMDSATREKETGIEMTTTLSKDDRPFLKDDLANDLVKQLQDIGESEEDLLKDFEFVDSELVEDEESEYDIENYLNSREDFAAQDPSEQDTPRYKVRYAYVKGTSKTPVGESRTLCKSLLSAGRVYRKEDVEALSSKGGAESKGQPYNVWLYKGGANCYHAWERRVYRKKFKKDGELWGGRPLQGTKKVSVNQAIREGAVLAKNNPLVAKAPIDTPTKGFKS